MRGGRQGEVEHRARGGDCLLYGREGAGIPLGRQPLSLVPVNVENAGHLESGKPIGGQMGVVHDAARPDDDDGAGLRGPRPCLPSQNELIAERRRRGVFSIRPGVTGLAQVSGVDMSDPAGCAALDARYMAGMGLLPDMTILFRTFVRPGPAVAPPQQEP